MNNWIEWNKILINLQYLENVESVYAYQPIDNIEPVLSYLSLSYLSGREVIYRVDDYSREKIEELYRMIREKLIDESIGTI